nr:hypothetical protein [Tanacetum cinerariifolium]
MTNPYSSHRFIANGFNAGNLKMEVKHGRMILESVDNGPFLWSTVEENGVTRPKKYSELSVTKAIQADCDVKATHIIIQGLPPKVYALVSTHKIAKELWERIQRLMQGTSLMNKRGIVSLNTKFLNTLPPEWSKFVTDVKLVRDLHTTNVDQLHAYLGQHEYHENEYASQAQSSTPFSITYPSNDFQSSVYHNVYNPSSSIPQVEYAPSVHQQSEFSQPETGLVVPVFQKGDDTIDAINHMMSFLIAVVTSRYPPTNNQLRNSSNPRQQATINNERGEGHMSKQCTKPKRKRDEAWFKDKVLLVQAQANGQVLHEEELEFLIALMENLSRYGSDNLAEVHNQDNVTNNVIDQDVQEISTSEQLNIMNQSETKITSDSNIILYSQHLNESQYTTIQNSSSPAQQDDLILSVIEQLKTQVVNCTKINQDNKNVNEILTTELDRYKDQVRILKEQNNFDKASASCTQSLKIDNRKHTLFEHLKEKESLEQMTELSAEQAFWSQNSRNYDEPNLSTSTTIVEVPKELPKVSMVNSSLKKLKFHLASFDMVVKERTTATRIKSLSGNVKEEKIKRELEEIETINIELDHRVTKIVAKNEHLKQTYKQRYDSIKSSCVRSKEQCDDLIKQVNIKSAKNSDEEGEEFIHPSLSTHDDEETRDEESFDPIPKTPENTNDEGNGKENIGMNVGREEGQDEDDEEDELYRDVNINLGRGIEPIFETTSQMDVQTPTSVAPLPVSAPTLTPSTITTITTIQQAPTPPTTAPGTLLQDLPNFGSLIVQRYIDQRMNEAVKNLYKGLVKAYESDKIILDTYGDIVTLKRRRDDDADKDKEPSARSDRGSKRRREGKEPESASAPKEKATRSADKSTQGSKSQQTSASESTTEEEPMQTTHEMEEPSHPEFETGADDQPIIEPSQHPKWFSQQKKPPTPYRGWNKTLPATHRSIQPWISELAKQTNSRSSFNELMDTPVDFSAFLMNRLKVDTLTLELLARPTYELMKGSCKSLVELEFFLEEVYKATTDQLDWVNPEGQQYPYNLLKPLPLIPNSQGRRVIPFAHFINNDLEYLRGGASSRKYTNSVTETNAADYGTSRKLTNLTVEERFAFNVSLRMFTRSIVIQRCVEDLQLNVESYQKRLNLTRPDTYRSDLKRKEAYIAYFNPRGFIYQNKDKHNRLMRIDELHKFSDGTLTHVHTTLDDRLKGIQMKYMPQTIWRKSDKDRAAAMI